MKRMFFGVLVIAAVCAFLAGPVGAQIPATPDWKEGFRAHDKNGDAKIDRGEFHEWMVDVFFLRDKGHKGYLVFEDAKDVMSPEIFKAHDVNGDGKLPLQEFVNSTFQDFDAADANKDGVLTMEEIDVYIKQTGK